MMGDLTKDEINLNLEDNGKDNVKQPNHYTQTSLECIEAMILAFGNDAVVHFCLCNAFKYAWRHKLKGSEKQDIQKAFEYIDIIDKYNLQMPQGFYDYKERLETILNKE